MAASTAAAARKFDIVLWGSTGFTGKYVAKHLAESYLPSPSTSSSPSSSSSSSSPSPRPLKWALAGRSLPKLEALRSELASEINPNASSVPLLVASLDDPASLDAALRSSKVVLSTAGPYAELGSEVVASAVRCGTHYADLTAEIPWILEMHDRHGGEAASNGVKVVHCAGFDSQPSDLTVFLMAKEAKRRHGVGLKEAWTLAGPAKGGFSGGTIESLLTACYEVGDEGRRKRADDLYCLVGGGDSTSPSRAAPAASADGTRVFDPSPPPPRTSPAAVPRGLLPRFVEPARIWTAPFVMSFVNERVARRSAALLPEIYSCCGSGEGGEEGGEGREEQGEEVPRITEGQALPNVVAAALVSSIMALGSALCKLGAFRALVRRVLPKRGSGPSDELCRGGNWRMDAVAVTRVDANGRRHVVRAVAEDPRRDPGYYGTARMLLELGIAMATQESELREAGCLSGGFLTPATAGGEVLVERLNRAGMRFEVVRDSEEEEEKKTEKGV